MPRKHHKMDRYDALGCMGCLIVIVASLILISFIACGILFISDIKGLFGV